MATLSAVKILAYDSTSIISADEDLADFDNGAVENEIDNIGVSSKVIFRVKNTAAAKEIVFKASDIGLNRGLGDLTRSLTQNVDFWFMLEGERFVNANGQIQFTLASGATGEISAIELLQ